MAGSEPLPSLEWPPLPAGPVEYPGAPPEDGWGFPDRTPAPSPAQARRRGFWSTLVAAGAAVLKLGAFKGTAITMVISVVVYTVLFGPVFAVGLVLLLLIHEMGHYRMAKRLGLSVTAPVFIPLLGAVMGIRRQPGSVRVEALVALAGPAVGTAASWVCVGLALGLRSELWAALGYLGCLLNLFNLIPATPLDGGRVTAAVSKWANLLGLAILLAYAFWASRVDGAALPVLVIIILFAVLGTISRFRQARVSPQYLRLPASQRWSMLGLYLALVGVAALGMASAYPLMGQVHRLGL